MKSQRILLLAIILLILVHGLDMASSATGVLLGAQEMNPYARTPIGGLIWRIILQIKFFGIGLEFLAMASVYGIARLLCFDKERSAYAAALICLLPIVRGFDLVINNLLAGLISVGVIR